MDIWIFLHDCLATEFLWEVLGLSITLNLDVRILHQGIRTFSILRHSIIFPLFLYLISKPQHIQLHPRIRNSFTDLTVLILILNFLFVLFLFFLDFIQIFNLLFYILLPLPHQFIVTFGIIFGHDICSWFCILNPLFDSFNHWWLWVVNIWIRINQKFYPPTQKSWSHFYVLWKEFYIVLHSAVKCQHKLGLPKILWRFSLDYLYTDGCSQEVNNNKYDGNRPVNLNSKGHGQSNC